MVTSHIYPRFDYGSEDNVVLELVAAIEGSRKVIWWNGSATFTVRDIVLDRETGYWHAMDIDAFTNYDVEDAKDAHRVAMSWWSDYGSEVHGEGR